MELAICSSILPSATAQTAEGSRDAWVGSNRPAVWCYYHTLLPFVSTPQAPQGRLSVVACSQSLPASYAMHVRMAACRPPRKGVCMRLHVLGMARPQGAAGCAGHEARPTCVSRHGGALDPGGDWGPAGQHGGERQRLWHGLCPGPGRQGAPLLPHAAPQVPAQACSARFSWPAATTTGKARPLGSVPWKAAILTVSWVALLVSPSMCCL